MTTPAPLMAEELMIGNWVQRPESLRNKLLDGDIIYWCVDITMLRDCEYYKENWAFEPIPLTEQWLKEFGFNSKGLIDGWYEKNILHEWVYILYNHQHGLCELIVSKHSMIPKNIKYVHQLQNLYFALTATKLERGGV